MKSNMIADWSKVDFSTSEGQQQFLEAVQYFMDRPREAAEEIRVKVIVKSGRNEVGTAAMAAYGFDAATKEIGLKKNEPNAITIMLTTEDEVEKLTISILDAGSQVELGRKKDIPVDISI